MRLAEIIEAMSNQPDDFGEVIDIANVNKERDSKILTFDSGAKLYWHKGRIVDENMRELSHLKPKISANVTEREASNTEMRNIPHRLIQLGFNN